MHTFQKLPSFDLVKRMLDTDMAIPTEVKGEILLAALASDFSRETKVKAPSFTRCLLEAPRDIFRALTFQWFD